MITLGNEIINVLAIYRLHSDPMDNFSCLLADILSSDKLRKKNCIVLADLKLNILDSFSEAYSFLNLIQSHYFVSITNKPTRFSTNENMVPTLLDHVCTNKISVLDGCIIEVNFTHHRSVCFRIPITATNCDSDCGRVRLHFIGRSSSNIRIFKLNYLV